MKERDPGFWKDISQQQKSEIKIQKNILPECRQIAFCKAIEHFLPEITFLAQTIKREMARKDWKFPEDFRIIIILLKVVFRLNWIEITYILEEQKNGILHRYLRQFAEYITISQEHLVEQAQWFKANYYSEFIELASKVKKCYHQFILEYYTEDYLWKCRQLQESIPIYVENMLETFDFTPFFPEAILDWQGWHAPDLLCKTFIYQKIKQITSLQSLEWEINRVIKAEDGYTKLFGVELGFYNHVPHLTTLYSAKSQFIGKQLNEWMLILANQLLKEGVLHPDILLIDSTQCHAQKDDPDLAIKGKKKKKGPERCHKLQVICDGSGIPLYATRRAGEEHDQKGFQVLKEPLVTIKQMATRLGKQLKVVLLDAGYCGQETFTFINEVLKGTSIINLNPGRSHLLKKLKQNIDAYREIRNRLEHLAPEEEPERSNLEIEMGAKIKKVQELIVDCKNSKSEFAQFFGNLLEEIGMEQYYHLYKNRSVIEGLFGMVKSCYSLLGRADRVLPVKGKEEVEIHSLLTLLAIQFLALINYRIYHVQESLLSSYYVLKLRNLKIYY